MCNCHDDDRVIVPAIKQTVRKPVKQAAANSWADLLIEFRKRDGQTHRPVEFIQKTVAQADNLGFIPREGFVKLQLRGGK